MQRLTNTKIKNIKPTKKIQKISDGNNLTLVVKPNGSKLFNYNFRLYNKQRTMSFGKYPEVSLEEARNQAKEVKKLLKQNIDPVLHRKQEALSADQENANTFEQVSKDWLRIKKGEFSEGHFKRCSRMIEIHLIPDIGKIPLKQITTPQVLRALRKIEAQEKYETAHRARQVASQVIRYGIQVGLVNHDVTQYLQGALKTPQPKHFSAITDPKELGTLLKSIDHYHGGVVVRTALRLTPHLFCRPGELRQLEWSHVDLEKELVTLPESITKSGREHCIPLSQQSLRLIEDLKPYTGKETHVFASPKDRRKCICNAAVLRALRSMGYCKEQITAHGFRATARTLLDEELDFRLDWVEHQLAHAVKDPNGRAYNRTTFLEKRRGMMQTWSDYLDELKA